MICISIMFKGNPWMKPGAGPVGNLLLVRKNRKQAKDDLARIKETSEVTGWAQFDEHGMLEDGGNSGMCLTWDTSGFDSIDVSYRTRY